VAVTRSPRINPVAMVAPDPGEPGEQQREDLGRSHQHCVHHGNVGLATVLCAEAFGRPHQGAAHDQGAGHHPQRREDTCDQGLSNTSPAGGGEDYPPCELVVAAAAGIGMENAAAPGSAEAHDVAEEIRQHRGDRTDLDHRGEPHDIPIVDRDTHQPFGDLEMPGGRNRENSVRPSTMPNTTA
jgi:hypothetical protein